MDLSLRPQQRPEQRLHTVTIDEIVSLGSRWDDARPPLENYFSPSRREQFEKDYIHYLNTLLLEMKHGNLDLDLYLVFVLTFQFIAPLLGIPAERELVQFCKILEEKYDVEEPDINLHFSTDEYVAPPKTLVHDAREASPGAAGEKEAIPGAPVEEDRTQGMIGEKEALNAFEQELDETFEGRREVKESVQKRLKQDGIGAIMKWQKEKDFPELAEAFGRSVVIPSFFSFRDRKLLGFYRSTTEGITYEVAVPEILNQM
jgi:hypothetical protein